MTEGEEGTDGGAEDVRGEQTGGVRCDIMET